MNANKRAFCKYCGESADDSSVEALQLYLPVNEGYINYNVVHSVMERTKCNAWRLSVAYFCNEALEPIHPLTRGGAEWEMALKIVDRPDFIGGYAHGDEVFREIKVSLDGKAFDLRELTELTAFGELAFEVWSVGYDPLDSCSEALLHYKRIVADESCVRVEQSVEWLNDYAVGRSYMAMMPPLKDVTDHYYTDADPIPKPLKPMSETSGNNVDAVYLCGEGGFTLGMRVEKYLSDKEKGKSFLITDNGGVPYNKMYFPLQHKGLVNKSDVWETVTVYAINRGVVSDDNSERQCCQKNK